jgi:hypothetical protein
MIWAEPNMQSEDNIANKEKLEKAFPTFLASDSVP